MRENERASPVKMSVTLLVFVVCSIAAFLSGGWLSYLLFGVCAYFCAEYLGEGTERQWLNRFSTEQAGFSITRIIFGVVGVLMVLALFVIGRMIYLRLFE